MGNALLSEDQIRHLMTAWKNAREGSQEQKLIEDLFLITETPMPGIASPQHNRAA